MSKHTLTAPLSPVPKRAKLTEPSNFELAEAALAEYKFGELDRTVPLKAFTRKLNEGLDGAERIAELGISSCRQEKYMQVELRVSGQGLQKVTVLRARRLVYQNTPPAEIRLYFHQQVTTCLADDTLRWLRDEVKIHGTQVDRQLHTSLDPHDDKKNIDNCLDVEYATRYLQSITPPHPALPKFKADFRTRGASLLSPEVLAGLSEELDTKFQRHEAVEYTLEVKPFQPQLARLARGREEIGTPWLVIDTRPGLHLVQVYLELRNRRGRSGRPAADAKVLHAQRCLDLWQLSDVRAYILGYVVLFTGQTTLAWLKKVVKIRGSVDNLQARLDPTQTARNADGSARFYKLFCPKLSSALPLHPELLSEAEHFLTYDDLAGSDSEPEESLGTPPADK